MYRPLRVAFFSTGDELKGVGTTLGEGEIYDSNRYTLYGMLTRLGCEVLDMGVVRDDPALLERAFREAAASADVVITSGGVSVGEADFVKPMLAKLGEVVFWKIAMKPGPPARLRQDRRRALLRPARQPGVGDGDLLPVRARRAAGPDGREPGGAGAHLHGGLHGETEEGARPYRVPARHPHARAPTARWTVRPTGEQGSGILKSMSDANCFIILGDDVGNVEPGHRGRGAAARGRRMRRRSSALERTGTGLEYLQKIVAGEYGNVPIGDHVGFRMAEVSKGRIVFTGEPGENVLNLIGTVHGGYAAAILDSALALSILSSLDARLELHDARDQDQLRAPDHCRNATAGRGHRGACGPPCRDLRSPPDGCRRQAGCTWDNDLPDPPPGMTTFQLVAGGGVL